MTVNELIELLGMEEGEAEVVVSCPSHDHWHTELAREPKRAEEACVAQSGYHDCDQVVEWEDAFVVDGEGYLTSALKEGHRKVVVL